MRQSQRRRGVAQHLLGALHLCADTACGHCTSVRVSCVRVSRTNRQCGSAQRRVCIRAVVVSESSCGAEGASSGVDLSGERRVQGKKAGD